VTAFNKLPTSPLHNYVAIQGHRQLFTATVAPAMDYASGARVRDQRAEMAGPSRSASDHGRLPNDSVDGGAGGGEHRSGHSAQAGTRLYIDLHTLPKTHSFAGLKMPRGRRFVSPMKLAVAQEDTSAEGIETIQAYALSP
jgi:hypothetical protein